MEKIKSIRAPTKSKMNHATFVTMAAKALQQRKAAGGARGGWWAL